MSSVAQKDRKREAQIHDPPHQMQALLLFPEGGWPWRPHTTRQTTNWASFRPSYGVKDGVEGRPWPAHSQPWTLSRANHPGPGRWRRTYRIKIGEEVDCGRRVERKWEKRLNVQRRLQRRGWRPDQGWESGALACATCTKEKRGHGQGTGAWGTHSTQSPRPLLRPKCQLSRSLEKTRHGAH